MLLNGHWVLTVRSFVRAFWNGADWAARCITLSSCDSPCPAPPASLETLREREPAHHMLENAMVTYSAVLPSSPQNTLVTSTCRPDDHLLLQLMTLGRAFMRITR
jgi:hypothetical protein